MPAEPPDIPGRRGGWWHEYVCPAHGTQLLPAEGDVFPCPHGCALTGEPYAGAWAVLAHQAAARSLRALAVSAREGDDAAADACVAGLVRYAGLYRELGGEPRTDAQGWMLAGKLFQQALTEAIWGTSLAIAVQNLAGGAVPADRLRPVAPLLEALLGSLRTGAAEARDVLLAKDDFRNNYTAWLNACGATTSRALALLGSADRTGEWLDGRHGLTEHLAAAVHPDGWEWEGSTYYHVFVLRAYLLALRGQPVTGALADRLAAMVSVVAALATDRGGVLPALNDTPYGDPGWDEEIYELCLLAGSVPGAPDLAFLARPVAARLPAELVAWRASEAHARSRPAPHPGTDPRASRLFRDAGYAVLTGDGYRAVLDLGPHGGSHGHLDKLALYLYGRGARWQPAFGVPPYGHRWRRGHYRATAAHPTLTVDGADQAEAAGRLLYWRCADGRAEVGAAADVYPGVRFERHVRAEAGWLLDVVRVAADRERALTLHLRTDVDVTVRTSPGGATTRWPGDGGLTGLHTALTGDGAATAVLTTAPDLGPADDPQRTRPHLRWHAQATDAVFASAYLPTAAATDAPTRSHAADLRIERSGTGVAVRLEAAGAHPVHWLIEEAP